jgi:hypothetical protein
MINHDRIFDINIKMSEHNKTFETNNFRSFFRHNCFFAIFLSMTRFFVEISAYFLSLFDEFFFVVVRSFDRLSSCHKLFMFFYVVNMTFYCFIQDFQFRRDWDFYILILVCLRNSDCIRIFRFRILAFFLLCKF